MDDSFPSTCLACATLCSLQCGIWRSARRFLGVRYLVGMRVIGFGMAKRLFSSCILWILVGVNVFGLFGCAEYPRIGLREVLVIML